MLGLAKKIAPLTYANFSKVKANQFGLNKPPGGLKPAPPGLKKFQTPNHIQDAPKKNNEGIKNLKTPFTNSGKVEIQAEESLKMAKKHPVITIMGHVDHGKTTLIDYLRNSDIAQKQDGGITQKIGAFRINFKGERITFIDTPGHEAFTNMRKRGATMTDLVVLVVSAVEGVKKQTIEVINLINKMELRCIVAINKIDLPQADPQEIQKQINKAGLNLEPLGGDIPVVHISAKTGLNLELLCELIQQETRNNMAVFEGLAQASVLEANQTKDGLNSMTIIIEKGVLKVNSLIILGRQSIRVKNIICDRGESLKQAYPGEAVQIIGIPFIPAPGDQIFQVESDKKAKFILDQKKDKQYENERSVKDNKSPMKASVKFETSSRQGRKERRAFFRGVQEVWMEKFAQQEQKIVEKIELLKEKEQNTVVEEAIFQLQLKLEAHKKYVYEYLKNTGDSPDTLNFMLKFGDRGMEQTILLQLQKLKPIIESETKVKLNLIKTDVGQVSSGDIEEAQNCSAKIFTFGTGISIEAKANLKDVDPPRTHKLIHNLLADIKETSFKKKISSIRGHERGRCQVAEIYNLKIKKSQILVPGIKVITGKISRQYKCYIFRNGIPISKPFSINFLKSFKKDMMEIKKGQQGTVGFSEQITDVEKGDQIVCFEV